MSKLNVEKLLETDFCDRLLGFVEAYDNVRNINSYDPIQKWIEENNFEAIKYFLDTFPIEYSLSLSIEDFALMDYTDLICIKELCSKVLALLDEKRALYQELNSFYL